MRGRDERITTKNIRCYCLIVWEENKKIRKTSEVGGIPPPLYVRVLSAKMRDNQQSGKVVFTDPIFLEARMVMLYTKNWLKLSTNYYLQKFR